ncbi:MAG: hypothetical protein ACP5SB_01775 [Caldisericaceae bacterium]
MTLKELLDYMKYLQKENIYVLSLNDIHIRFAEEDRNSIISEMSRFVNSGVVKKLTYNFYINPFLDESKERILIEFVKKVRQLEFFYLSLDYRAFELGLISQTPNVMTFVTTNGLSKFYVTTLGMNVSFVKQKKSMKGIHFDKERGIYVADKERVLYDAKIHKLEYLLDLIEEKEGLYEKR